MEEIFKNSYIQKIMGAITGCVTAFILIFKFKMSVSSIKLAVIFILTIMQVAIFLIKYFKMPKSERSIGAAFKALFNEKDKENKELELQDNFCGFGSKVSLDHKE